MSANFYKRPGSKYLRLGKPLDLCGDCSAWPLQLEGRQSPRVNIWVRLCPHKTSIWLISVWMSDNSLFSFNVWFYWFLEWLVISDHILDILAIVLGDSRSNLKFLGGNHMFRLSTQALAYFYGPWFQWQSNFRHFVVLFWSAWFISCPGVSIGPCWSTWESRPSTQGTGVCFGRIPLALSSGSGRGISGLKSFLCLWAEKFAFLSKVCKCIHVISTSKLKAAS